jgi:hypothetical protein
MQTPSIAARALGRLATLGEQIAVVIVFTIATGAVFYGTWYTVDFAAKQHWMLGIAAAVLFLGMLIALQGMLHWGLSSPWWEKLVWGSPHGEGGGLIQKHRGLSVVLLFVMVVCVAIGLMARISGILHSQAGWVTYAPPSAAGASSPPLAGEALESKLLEYYGWHAIDAIPVLDVWKAFKVEAPLTASDETFAGVLVFGFRLVIVALSIVIAQKWLGRKKERT